MWIEADGPHKRLVNAAKLDTMYVTYKGSGNWSAIGTVGDRDIFLKMFKSETEASGWLSTIRAKLEG